MTLAIFGGQPVRQRMLPYARQFISNQDKDAITAVLDSAYLTTGPLVNDFEDAFAIVANSKHAVALSSGTAALHAAMHILDIGPGDEVIVPAITFVATANCVLYQGGMPVFADVEPDTLLIDPRSVQKNITGKTRAIIAVDYAGQPCDYEKLRNVATAHNLKLVTDASHSLGSSYSGKATGSIADLTTFSFHPVKHITTGEGGMVTTDDEHYAERLRCFRNHGITQDHRQRSGNDTWFYEMKTLGFNYRITDIQCALGLSQMQKLYEWIDKRNEIANYYHEAFKGSTAIKPLQHMDNVTHAYHLYVIRLNAAQLTADRDEIYSALRAEGIGVNVHYMPVYLHPYYRDVFGDRSGLCPDSESAFQQILTLPLFPEMSKDDRRDVVDAVNKVTDYYGAN